MISCLISWAHDGIVHDPFIYVESIRWPIRVQGSNQSILTFTTTSCSAYSNRIQKSPGIIMFLWDWWCSRFEIWKQRYFKRQSFQNKLFFVKPWFIELFSSDSWSNSNCRNQKCICRQSEGMYLGCLRLWLYPIKKLAIYLNVNLP